MTNDEIRTELKRILAAHDDAIATIRATSAEPLTAFAARDAAISNVIEANRAAIRLLGQLDDRGRPKESFWAPLRDREVQIAIFQLASWIWIFIYLLWLWFKK